MDKPLAVQMGVMAILFVQWFVRYALGWSGKQKGKPQIQELHQFVKGTLLSFTTFT
ncbi:MAG: hypothetical protein WBG48_07345 [Pricia sp.]